MEAPSGQPARPSSPSLSSSPSTPSPSPSPRAWVPHFVLWLSLIVTAGASLYVRHSARQQDEERFRAVVERTLVALAGRAENHTASPLNVAALFETAGNLPSRQQVHAYLGKLEIPSRYPGIQGVGFSVRSPAKDLKAFEKVARENDVDPNFTIHPLEPARETYDVVMYLEPPDPRNRALLGFDLHSDPVLAAAMDDARDTGAMRASGRVQLPPP